MIERSHGLKARSPILDRNRGIVQSNIGVPNEFFAEFPKLFDWREPDGRPDSNSPAKDISIPAY